MKLVPEGERSVQMETSPLEWREERLRFQVLRCVYQHTGSDCTATVRDSQIGAALSLPFENLFRAIHFLEREGYLHRPEPGPWVCIATRGVDYLEHQAGRRQSIRG